MSNSLDPDQARRFVGPDLVPNCLSRLSAYGTGRQRVNKGFNLSFISLLQQYNFVCEFRQLYEDYKKENDAEQRSISR